MMRCLLTLILSALSLAACGSAQQPVQPSARTLHRDLERLVELKQTEGWTIDRVEVDETLPDALSSVCRTTPDSHQELLTWLDGRIAEEGGSPADAYEARGRDMGAIESLLSLTRIRMLLVRSMEAASADCPFWFRPKVSFRGQQVLDDRWLLSFGGGGKGILVGQGGEYDLHFGGAGRLLFGRAIGARATLLAGVEFGGSASFPKDEQGDRGEITVAVDAVVPLVYRHRRVNSYWEVEAGYLAHLEENNPDAAHGFHLGAAIGGSGKRRRWFFPGVAFGINYEQIRDDATLHVIKMGFRVVIDMAR